MLNDNYYLARLEKGEVHLKHFILLIEISSIRSEKIINALKDYYVKGEDKVFVCQKHMVGLGYLSLKIKELQLLSKKVFEIYPYYIR
ncbi:hypothetical protein ABFP30_002930 [Enterobacter bugandensis]